MKLLSSFQNYINISFDDWVNEQANKIKILRPELSIDDIKKLIKIKSKKPKVKKRVYTA